MTDRSFTASAAIERSPVQTGKTPRLAFSLCLFGLVALAAGCASSEGGVVGSGISSVSGNVSLVAEQADVTADGSLETVPFVDVRVVEAPDVATTTDVEGNFELTGAFSGDVTLRFARAGRDEELGRLSVLVPLGSTVVLQDVEIRPESPPEQRVRPQAIQQFDFFGRVATADCEPDGTGVLLVDDDAPPPARRQQLVRVGAETEITFGEDRPVGCEDVRSGDRVLLVGVILPDRTLAALRVVVAPPQRPDPLKRIRPITLRGILSGTMCASGFLQVVEVRNDESIRRRAGLLPETEIVFLDSPQEPFGCSDFVAGDMVEVDGFIDVRRPGVVTAQRIRVSRVPRPVVVEGSVVALACAAGTIVLQTSGADPVRLRIELSRATELECAATVACSCADIRRGDGARVEGTFRVDHPRTIEASRIVVRRR